MVSHRISAPISCVFFYHISAFGKQTRVSAIFRVCFRVMYSLENVKGRSRYGTCYTRAVILDRAKLTEVLGTEVPLSVRGVGGVTHDSRRVEPGFAFVAVPGFKRDGTEFAPE